MKSHHLFVVVLFLLAFFLFSEADEWEPIGDKNDPHLIEIAKFAFLFSEADEWEPIGDKNDPHLIEIAKFAFLFSEADKWEPIGDKNDPHLIEIAKFAVTEHNKAEKTYLVFDKIFSGKTKKAVQYQKYQLVLDITADSDKYETRVH